ncbi:hypothetical protein ATSB10_18460 [Dyella thiooxydans]|uniref:Uncharacterized protein n=1 Tax=Dyella thiooxydans TaxID=445710 RepID=A0A160N0T2_9GAMM|nr:hypothetical protein ATSB10_18460 [Dyella thiooxydans]
MVDARFDRGVEAMYGSTAVLRRQELPAVAAPKAWLCTYRVPAR